MDIQERVFTTPRPLPDGDGVRAAEIDAALVQQGYNPTVHGTLVRMQDLSDGRAQWVVRYSIRHGALPDAISGPGHDGDGHQSNQGGEYEQVETTGRHKSSENEGSDDRQDNQEQMEQASDSEEEESDEEDKPFDEMTREEQRALLYFRKEPSEEEGEEEDDGIDEFKMPWMIDAVTVMPAQYLPVARERGWDESTHEELVRYTPEEMGGPDADFMASLWWARRRE